MRNSPTAFLIAWLAFCQFCIGAGTWNGVAFTAWNGVAITAWNGTGISAAGGGGTDWTADGTFVAHYQFESSPGIDQDSDSTNEVDDAATIEDPAADTGDKIEGAQSADFEMDSNDDGLILNYANATADFPCNGTGDAEVTIAGWIRLESSTATEYVMAINGGAQFIRVLSTNVVEMRFTGTGNTTHTSTATIPDGTWTFIAAVYSDANNEVRCYIRQQGAGAFTIETSASTIGTLASAGSGNFQLSGLSDSTSTTGPLDGKLDGWAVLNGTAMTQAQLEGVFDNGWDGNGW